MWPGVQNIIHNLLWEILFRVIILSTVCIAELKVPPRVHYVTETDLVTYYNCPRHDSYITPIQMVGITVMLPLLVIYLVFLETRNYVDTIQALLAWTLAMSYTAMVTEGLKLSVGRPRPDFLYRCFPNGQLTSGLYCTGNLRDVNEGRKSFPSGHSSFSFCSLGFISIWMCGKLEVVTNRTDHSWNWRLVVCILPLIGSGAVAISRYYDNHHHWEDIFAGAMLGLASSYLCYRTYYYSISSPSSGEPLTAMTESDLYESYQLECCSRNLNDDLCRLLHISNNDIVESNKVFD